MGKYIFSKEKELQIVEDYESGLSTYEVAKICGCGNATIRYIVLRNGHVLRNYSDAQKGKKLSEITKRKIQEKTMGKNNHMFGKHIPDIVKKKMSISRKKYLENPEAMKMQREFILKRFQNYQGPFKDTKPELKMEEILIFLHIPYEKQFRVGNHLADFHLLDTNRLIEVDGDYWHGNPKKFSTLNKIQLKQKERDIKNDRVAKEKGFVILRFWENDILNNKEFVITKLSED